MSLNKRLSLSLLITGHLALSACYFDNDNDGETSLRENATNTSADRFGPHRIDPNVNIDDVDMDEIMANLEAYMAHSRRAVSLRLLGDDHAVLRKIESNLKIQESVVNHANQEGVLQQEASDFAENILKMSDSNQINAFADEIESQGAEYFAALVGAYFLHEDAVSSSEIEGHRAFAESIANSEDSLQKLATLDAIYFFIFGLRDQQGEVALQEAQSFMSKENPDIAFAIYYDAYQFAKQTRGLTEDVERDSFANEMQEEGVVFWMKYQEAYVYARDEKGVTDDTELHQVAMVMAILSTQK